MTEADETAVLIVGAGPVGTTLAMDLARLGVPSIVVERRRLIPPNPRCNTTNARSKAWCRLFSEPGAGSDLAGLTCRAVECASRATWAWPSSACSTPTSPRRGHTKAGGLGDA